MSLSKNPAFNLKVVLQETNIPADTLRAWERRYGLPKPQRTAGGHRLYSQYDIEMIKWLLKRQSEGLSISRAVDLWNEITSSGVDPIASVTSKKTFVQEDFYLPSETSLDSLCSHWLSACLAFDETKAEQILNQAFAVYPMESVCMEVLQHGLVEIGLQWQENRASVQQEHFTSALAIRRVNTLISESSVPERNKTILIGCPAEEEHTFPPLLVSLFLRRRGFHVIYLGANVPDERFEETVEAVRADLVVLVAQQLITAANLQKISHILSRLNIPIAYGGRIFDLQPQIIGNISGFYLGNKIKEAVEQIEDLAVSQAQNPHAKPIAPKYELAIAAFQSGRANIEVTVKQFVESPNYGEGPIKIATEYLGRNILAALRLGRISLVDEELDWVKSLIKSNRIPEVSLTEFIKLYAKAVSININDSGKLVSDWLNMRAGNG